MNDNQSLTCLLLPMVVDITVPKTALNAADVSKALILNLTENKSKSGNQYCPWCWVDLFLEEGTSGIYISDASRCSSCVTVVCSYSLTWLFPLHLPIISIQQQFSHWLEVAALFLMSGVKTAIKQEYVQKREKKTCLSFLRRRKSFTNLRLKTIRLKVSCLVAKDCTI